MAYEDENLHIDVYYLETKGKVKKIKVSVQGRS